jgi:hypothetical protein
LILVFIIFFPVSVCCTKKNMATLVRSFLLSTPGCIVVSVRLGGGRRSDILDIFKSSDLNKKVCTNCHSKFKSYKGKFDKIFFCKNVRFKMNYESSLLQKQFSKCK